MKETLLRHGFVFESDTDTEVIPKLAKFVHDSLTAETKDANGKGKLFGSCDLNSSSWDLCCGSLLRLTLSSFSVQDCLI